MRVVGQTVDGEFRKRVHRSKHFLHTPPAIAIEADVFDQLGAEFIDLIRVKDEERIEYWETPYDIFNRHKFRVERGGFGAQYALTLEWWDIHDSEGNLTRPRRQEVVEKKLDEAEQTKKCDELLAHFKPEFGNQAHIDLAKRAKQLNQLRGHKKPNKKEIDRIEKIIISTLQKHD